MKGTTFFVLIVALAAAPVTPQRLGADLVLTNGRIYSVDSHLGWVEALAITQDKIVAVGTSKEIRHWIGPNTEVIDLQGRFVMPGFNDAHVHLALASRQLLNVNLEGTRSIAELQQRIRENLKDFEPGEWIIGGGWDHSLLEEKRIPTRAELDAVSTEHPLFLHRVDWHSAVANSFALQLAGITRETPDPPGGEIVRDAEGEPTGWLKDRALDLVTQIIPPLTLERRKRGTLLVLEQAARYGVTTMQDDSIRFDGWDSYRALRELKEDGKLTARITMMLPFEAPLDRLREMQKEGGTDDPWLKTGPLKAEVDGSGGSLSAAMFEPFANDPENDGYMKIEPERLRTMVLERDAAGLQMALHAIGDRANRIVLDAYEAASKKNKRRKRRHRIEHVQYLHRDDRDRFRELGVIASMQPCHLLAEIRWTSTILGPEREYEAYALNSLLNSGAVIALGTDYPVEGLNPLRGIYAAVARQFEEGGPQGGWAPEEKISVEDAIQAYTLGSAFAEFEDHRKGTLAPGKLADLIVLSRDLTRVPPQEILRTEVVLTVVGGKIVYEKEYLLVLLSAAPTRPPVASCF
ncbi:amidohydrolase [Acidobacteriia bacterium AH_259_A11_L15]|nr:amidohydrolase [Acidobacteriia bacterium AH_259_A11_L15]